MPGKPQAYNYGLLWLIYGLLYAIVAHFIGLLGVPGGSKICQRSRLGQGLRAFIHRGCSIHAAVLGNEFERVKDRPRKDLGQWAARLTQTRLCTARSPILLLPGRPVAYNSGLLWLIYGLLWGVLACCFRLLGFPGQR